MAHDIPTRASALGDMWRPVGPRAFMNAPQTLRCPRPPRPGFGPFAFTTYLTQLDWFTKIYPNCPTHSTVIPLGGLGDSEPGRTWNMDPVTIYGKASSNAPFDPA